MNPIKSPYDLLLERAGLQYGNPATPVKGAQDMMAEMIAAGHPIQKFKEGKKATAKMAPGATLPDTTHTPLLQQGKDRLQQMGQNILDAHARQQALQNQAFEPNSVTKVRDPQALSQMANDMLAGPLGFMPAGIIKQKGGQWLDTKLDRDLKYLKYGNQGVEEHLNYPSSEEIANMTPHMQNVWRNINNERKHNEVLNKWVDSNLKNYVKNQMGTQEDPIRALAEEGVSHIPLDYQRNVGQFEPWTTLGKHLSEKRSAAGFPVTATADTNLGKQWENLTDSAIRSDAVQNMLTQGEGTWSPWLRKIEDRNTPVHQANGNISTLGFDHILDVLKQDLASGAIRPEQLNKISVSDAVRRAHLFDQEMAKKMAQAKLQAQTEMPVHKDYGESGYKWYELKHPTNPDITEQALKYEGDTMGHCVGGYCPDVLAGRSKIYSLRDAKGEPHVTVEVAPPQYGNKFGHLSNLVGEEKANEMFSGVMFDKNLPKGLDLFDAIKQKYNFSVPELPGRIIQIKGKQNAAPKDEYLPYVQDFVKSGNWEHVGDLYNAKLYDTSNMAELANVYPSNAALQDLHRNARFSILNRAQKQNTYPTDRFITREDYENLLLQNRPPQIPE